MKRLKGIDVSVYQQGLQLHDAKAWGAQFIYAKATEGKSWVDPAFLDFRKRAEEVNLPFGAYHFYHFTQAPDLQARHFLNTAEPMPGELIPMVDVEVQSEKFDPEALAHFLKIVEDFLWGDKILIYTFYSYWNDVAGGTDEFSGHPLWIAESEDPDEPGALPRGWKDWFGWQLFPPEPISGYECDVDIFKGLLWVKPPG